MQCMWMQAIKKYKVQYNYPTLESQVYYIEKLRNNPCRSKLYIVIPYQEDNKTTYVDIGYKERYVRLSIHKLILYFLDL